MGLSFYDYPPCCRCKLSARSIDALRRVRAAHLERCPKAKQARDAVQELLRPPQPAQEALDLGGLNGS